MPGFEYRDQHHPLAGLPDRRPERVVNPGPQAVDAVGNISAPHRVTDTLTALQRSKKLDQTSFDAGRVFERDFGIANLVGVHAVDWFRAGPGSGPMGQPYRVTLARDRVMSAIRHLGGIGRPQAEVAWHIIGLGMTIRDFAEKKQHGGNPHYVSGLVVGACASLASHYRMA